MQVQTHTWENALLVRAYEARHATVQNLESTWIAPELLEQAYAYCESITAQHSKSFYYASSLLPKEKRLAVRALYAFCRVTDDTVDSPSPNRAAELECWKERSLASTPPQEDLVAIAWTDTRSRFAIPTRYAEQLIDGVAQDLVLSDYETFDQLAAYSYGVASTVGLMSMHIVGYSSSDAIRYAIKLGVALQLTNILRDVAEDWRMGRLYLPAEEMEEFGVSRETIAAGENNEAWQAFMQFQIERNRRLYAEAMPGLAYLHDDGRFSIGAAAEFYQAILGRIERQRYDVFSGRAAVSSWGKLRRLPGIWWRSRHYRIDNQT